jgi:DNA-binding FadR family transcriptional regulator
MMEARRLVEPRSAELAAANRDQSNLDRNAIRVMQVKACP